MIYTSREYLRTMTASELWVNYMGAMDSMFMASKHGLRKQTETYARAAIVTLEFYFEAVESELWLQEDS